MAQNSGGGSNTAPNRAPAAKVIAGALANNRVAASLIAALGAWSTPALIIATSVSSTVNFAALLPGDYVIHIPAVAGNADFTLTATAGTLAEAAVVGDMYVVMRAVNLDSNNPLAGSTTGNGGLEF